MRNLVRRYVTVEQRKAENQGVTEDDVNEIKQDISAFRCELVEILKNSGMNTSTAATTGQGIPPRGSKLSSKSRLHPCSLLLFPLLFFHLFLLLEFVSELSSDLLGASFPFPSLHLPAPLSWVTCVCHLFRTLMSCYLCVLPVPYPVTVLPVCVTCYTWVGWCDSSYV